MYTVRRLDMEGFRQAREAWNGLASSMALPSIFCTWEWVYTWWEHFGHSYDPVILAVYDGPVLIGIMPLALQKANTASAPLKGRVLSYCGSKEVYPDHIDIICAGQDAVRCLSAVFDFLTDEFKAWDIIEVSMLSEGSELLSFIGHGQLGYEADVKQSTKSPFISLEGGFDSYMQSFNSKQRYSIRSRQRKLYEQSGSYYCAGIPSESTADLKTLFRLHAMRAERKNIVSTFHGEALFNFHDALVRRLNQEGRVWLRFIRNSSDVMAAFYGFSFGGHLFYYQLGLDPELECYAPGKVLIYEVIKESFDAAYKEFDFLRGDENYKSSWTKESRDLFAVSIYNRTIMASVTKKVSKSKDLLKRHVKRFIR